MSNTRKPKGLSPLREALAKKKTLHTYFDLAIVDSDVIEEKQQRVNIAQQLVAATLMHEDADVRAKADEALEQAKAARATCFHRIYFRGLSHDDFDALVALHPPTEEQHRDGRIWNPDTFAFALIAECAVDSDLTADEWREELADGERWSRADVTQLKAMALAANRQTISDAIPKD